MESFLYGPLDCHSTSVFSLPFQNRQHLGFIFEFSLKPLIFMNILINRTVKYHTVLYDLVIVINIQLTYLLSKHSF